MCVFRSLQFLELNTLALRVEKTSETASLTARDPLIWPRPGRGNEAEYRAIDQRYVERKRRIRIKSERRLTLTGARKSGAVTACGLTWWWAWLWWPWWWCLVSGPPPAAACSAWTDIAARACRSRSRSRSRSTLKDQCFLRLFHYKRLYSATIDFISKYKSIDIFLSDEKNEKRMLTEGREKEQNFHGLLLPKSRSIMKVQYFLRL